jgi:multiple antibiotic resistance protein
MLDWSELQNWNEYLKLLVGLLAIIDPLAVVPAFLSLAGRYTTAEKRQIATVAPIAVFFTLLIFTFFGAAILELFAISLAAFRIAGGILLLLLALDMMRSHDKPTDAPQSSSPKPPASLAIIPLAIPLMAGPGAISTVIIYSTLHESFSHKMVVTGVLVMVAIIVFAVLQLSTRAEKFLGKTSMMVFSHIMGLIIAAVAIEFMLDGLAAHFPSLGEIQH